MDRELSDAVVLLSGGLDSATTLAVAARECERCSALTFRYGQRAEVEVDCARRIAESMDVADHLVLDLPLDRIGGSALTDTEMEVPSAGEGGGGIPSTYVPARNTIFLSCALAFAETRQADRIYIGANCRDFSGYPDCRPEFLEAFQEMANLATKRALEEAPVRIEAPLLHLPKADIVRRGAELGVDFALTQSCYNPDEHGRACGECESCRLRLQAFEEAGLTDPAEYA